MLFVNFKSKMILTSFEGLEFLSLTSKSFTHVPGRWKKMSCSICPFFFVWQNSDQRILLKNLFYYYSRKLWGGNGWTSIFLGTEITKGLLYILIIVNGFFFKILVMFSKDWSCDESKFYFPKWNIFSWGVTKLKMSDSYSVTLLRLLLWFKI